MKYVIRPPLQVKLFPPYKQSASFFEAVVLHVLEQQAREFLCAVVTGEVVAVKEVGVGETSVGKVVQEDDVGIVCGNG